MLDGGHPSDENLVVANRGSVPAVQWVWCQRLVELPMKNYGQQAITQVEQQSAFSNDLEKLVNHYANEFDLSYQSVIGCLELEKAKLLNEMLNPELFEDDDE